jgi:hypothetical protein
MVLLGKKITMILICLFSVSKRSNEPFRPNRKDVTFLMHTILIFRYVLLKFKYMLDIYKYNNVSFSHVSCFGFYDSKVRNGHF